METKRNSYTLYSLLPIFLLDFSSVAFTDQQPTNTSVLDLDGNLLQINTKYYILPLDGGGGGGFALSVRDPRDPCPPNVVQENDEGSAGLSLKFFPLDREQQQATSVSLSSDMNIAFMAATTCVQRTVWRTGVADGTTGRRYVRTGGVLGRPGAETVGEWFKIDKYGKGYKIGYCPSVCSACRVECGEMGVFVEDGRRWVGLGGQPIVIAFKKVV
ncbi:kunitz trypsin inhibitor 2-like [Sesamum indicum]|uniref:Kunitz trypsin inhibitor 2-like n=1 Tax=Sesamum indicum TaxID=4182 RepID=A0A6I9UER4_SESIN|nr:kunitz trypsin inhibitor 2-like [Sesamum indicum]